MRLPQRSSSANRDRRRLLFRGTNRQPTAAEPFNRPYEPFYRGEIPESKGREGEMGDSRNANRGKTRGRQRIVALCAPEEPIPSPARRFLPGGPGQAGESAPEAGYTSSVRRSGRHAGWMVGAYGRVPGRLSGGAHGSKGSSTLRRSPCRLRRMRSMTHGSVMKETIRVRAPQEQTRDRSRRFFRIRRAHVLRASPDDSGFSRSAHESAAASGLSRSTRAVTNRRRSEQAP